MQELLDFFINIQKLKKKKRKGWVVHQIEDAESTASHIFRTAILTWILARRKKLNIKKVIKMALLHDLCEVFTFDETPYDPLLLRKIDSPQAQRKINEVLRKWPKFTLQQKREKVRKKAARELRAFKKLISNLPIILKNELETLWLDFEKGLSKEARFVKQTDKAENFLQGLEYWEKYGKIQRDLWLRWAREIFDDPVMIQFEQAIERRFCEKSKVRAGGMDKILDFLIQVGKLKTLLRKGPVLIEAKNPETIAEHIFRVAIMGWILGEAKKVKFNIERILKLALIHDLCEVSIGDISPYDGILPKDKKEWPGLFDKWPRFSKTEKRKIIRKKQKRETKALERLIVELPWDLKKEIKSLWLDYRQGSTKEARFIRQVNRIETLLQALEYSRQDKRRPFKSWWIGSVEQVDDPLLVKFMEGLDKNFVHG